ncbi:hypothetical protein FB451DRAFT_1189004 [Mycena latifolia]|nr:hypothetical protein FB451DRAFT_1189004 [Mycena latifolia]
MTGASKEGTNLLFFCFLLSRISAEVRFRLNAIHKNEEDISVLRFAAGLTFLNDLTLDALFFWRGPCGDTYILYSNGQKTDERREGKGRFQGWLPLISSWRIVVLQAQATTAIFSLKF